MSETFVFQAFVFLAAAVIAVPIAKRMGLGSALGYLLAGVIIGPYILGLVGDEGQDVMHFAEFGVVLMLFLVGLELQPSMLWRLRVPILGMGGMQVGITALAIGVVMMLFEFEWPTALAIGLTVALSSTAMVLQTLEEKGWTRLQAGRRAFSVLLFQDIAVIPILALLPLLAVEGIAPVVDTEHSVDHASRPGWLQALIVAGEVIIIIVAGRFLTRPVFNYIARTRSQEMFIATSLLLIMGITMAMNFAGLSPALGTFLAGVVLADSEFRHEMEANIQPFKGLLLGVFFIAVGSSIDFRLFFSDPALVLLLVGGLITIKFVILYFLGRFFRLALADSLLFAFTLAQGGEFAFLLVSFGLQNAVLPAETANMLILVVVLSMAITPLFIILFEKVIQPRLAHSCEGGVEDAGEIEEQENPVIIAGYGRFGQVVGRLLNAAGYQATLLDHDAGQIELVGRFGYKVFYGDASRTELLTAAGARHAKVLIVAIDEPEKAVKLVEAAKAVFPHLKVLARSVDRPHTYELIRAGTDWFARETFGSAMATGEEALRQLGVPDERARRMSAKFERHDTEGLLKLYEVWGDDEAYGFRMTKNLDTLQRVLQDDEATRDEEQGSGKGDDLA